MQTGWIGVDLDGTLAKYTTWKGMSHIGKPVPKMKARVLQWLRMGKTIKIFTARVSSGGNNDVAMAKSYIEMWLENNGFPKFEITCEKDFGMIELWDDRCIQVEPNTGKLKEGVWM